MTAAIRTPQRVRCQTKSVRNGDMHFVASVQRVPFTFALPLPSGLGVLPPNAEASSWRNPILTKRLLKPFRGSGKPSENSAVFLSQFTWVFNGHAKYCIRPETGLNLWSSFFIGTNVYHFTK